MVESGGLTSSILGKQAGSCSDGAAPNLFIEFFQAPCAKMVNGLMSNTGKPGLGLTTSTTVSIFHWKLASFMIKLTCDRSLFFHRQRSLHPKTNCDRAYFHNRRRSLSLPLLNRICNPKLVEAKSDAESECEKEDRPCLTEDMV